MLDVNGGIALNYDNVRALCGYLKGKLPFLESQAILSQFEPTSATTLSEFYLRKARAHPLAVDWYYLEQQVENSERAKTLLLSDQSMFLLDSLVRLSELLDVSGIERLLARIQNPKEYYSASFEALTLSQYRQSGFRVEIVPEEPIKGIRRPDFKVRTNDGEVFIECKSLEDFSRREGRIWEQAEAKVIKALSRFRRYWRVSIKADRELKGVDIENIRKLVSARARTNSIETISSDDGKIQIWFEVLASDSNWIAGEISYRPQMGQRGYIEAESWTDPIGKKYHRNPFQVISIPHLRADDTRRILADIGDAHGQLGTGELGIVHIEIPYRDSARLLSVSDAAFQRVFGLLKRRRKLSCAVLSARAKDQISRPDENPLMDIHAIVPNPAAKLLPKSFFVLGSREEALYLPAKKHGLIRVRTQ
ncbi:MAG: hypothetical protein K9G60_15360 [Pseudolabrys sp.]|nr:hypothetical protein [Pseudolabrys sp.]